MATPLKNLKVEFVKIQDERIKIRKKVEYFLDALEGNDINIYKSKIKELVDTLNSEYSNIFLYN